MGKTTKIFSGFLLAFVFVVVVLIAFLVGYIQGYGYGKFNTESYLQQFLSARVSSTTKPISTVAPSATIRPTVKPKPTSSQVVTTGWGGPQLWEAANKRRVELGVNPLSVKDELCTIASIRLNQVLAKGSLDGHEGFGNMPSVRPDLKWIFDKYNLSEFLVSGATSPQDAVSLWENSLGHKQLLSGGEYVWGCIYAQSGFGVAIAAY
jgi:uncharacterized protein YkwD